MGINDFVCSVINLPESWLDGIVDEFDIDYDTEDICDAIKTSDPEDPTSIGSSIALMVIGKLQEHFGKLFPTFDSDKFDWYINGRESHLYYDGDQICCDDDMQNAITHQDEDDME